MNFDSTPGERVIASVGDALVTKALSLGLEDWAIEQMVEGILTSEEPGATALAAFLTLEGTPANEDVQLPPLQMGFTLDKEVHMRDPIVQRDQCLDPRSLVLEDEEGNRDYSYCRWGAEWLYWAMRALDWDRDEITTRLQKCATDKSKYVELQKELEQEASQDFVPQGHTRDQIIAHIVETDRTERKDELDDFGNKVRTLINMSSLDETGEPEDPREFPMAVSVASEVASDGDTVLISRKLKDRILTGLLDIQTKNGRPYAELANSVEFIQMVTDNAGNMDSIVYYIGLSRLVADDLQFHYRHLELLKAKAESLLEKNQVKVRTMDWFEYGKEVPEWLQKLIRRTVVGFDSIIEELERLKVLGARHSGQLWYLKKLSVAQPLAVTFNPEDSSKAVQEDMRVFHRLAHSVVVQKQTADIRGRDFVELKGRNLLLIRGDHGVFLLRKRVRVESPQETQLRIQFLRNFNKKHPATRVNETATEYLERVLETV